MVNTFKTPFRHVRYALVRNQEQLDWVAGEFGIDKATFIELGCDTEVLLQDGAAIVQIPEGILNANGYGLLAHECMHVWQYVKEQMHEKEPSEEFEAYSFQGIFQDLLGEYMAN